MAKPARMRKLTPKMVAFVEAILAGSNPSEAYRSAYNAEKMQLAAIKVNAQKLLQHTNLALTIAERRAVLADKSQVTRERLVEEYAKSAFVDMSTYATWGPDGVRLKSNEQLPEGASQAVVEVSEHVTENSRTTRFRLHDKLKALDSLARILGYDKPDNRGDQPVQVTKVTVILYHGDRQVVDGEVVDARERE